MRGHWRYGSSHLRCSLNPSLLPTGGWVDHFWGGFGGWENFLWAAMRELLSIGGVQNRLGRPKGRRREAAVSGSPTVRQLSDG